MLPEMLSVISLM